MKFRYLFLFLVVGLFFTVGVNVNAAGLPYDWIVDGEEVFDSNTSQTATVTKDSNTVTLTLNNYNGNSLKLNCYGTAQDGITFVINLVGDNNITTDGVGIDFDYNGKIVFNGDGKLTINSTISYENYSSYLYISPSENIYTDKELSDNSTTNDEIDIISDQKSDNNTVNKANDKSEDNNNLVMILAIAFGLYFLISIIVFVMLISKNKKLKNNLGSSN